MKIQLKCGIIYNRETLVAELVNNGYSRVSVVIDRGELAVRGGVIDIYPLNQSDPIRAEFFGNMLESLRSFSVSTQLSTHHLTETVVTSEKSFKNVLIEEESLALMAESNIEEIEIGDYVVHERYGISIFRGLRRVVTHSIEGEFYLFEFDNREELYIPVLQSHLVHKYIGGENMEPQLSSLSKKSWKKDTTKAKKAVKNIAMDLFKIYKARINKKGFSLQGDEELITAMEDSFPYKETKDQLEAWLSVKENMEQTYPMDRLICGDVGFGKTEIAIRAAFKAVVSQKQVAILVPTTVLARQHYLNFTKRLDPFSVRVAMLSRFNTPTQNKKIVQKVNAGLIDIVIGTHRLIQKDVDYHDLGLLIIDEEQRFGVEHKEKIKAKYPLVDVLLLSATPIPRTLYFALSGARNIDIINTPPPGRHPIQTVVAEYEEEIVREAINKELARGGQVFFLHNDIKTLPSLEHQLKLLIPDLKIAIAHGRMTKNQMESVLVDFLERKVDLLLCTTIIENGVDIPSVNTIIINNADCFGLSQLHQIRGRVGRSSLQAYAYMFYKKNKMLSEISRKRLHSLKEFAALGAGYQIALKDLEIRGSGSILGREQSGHMITIGFTLFMRLLESELTDLKGETIAERTISFPLQEENFIPDDYLIEEELRISFYQKLFGANDIDELKEVEKEMVDRFGKLPPATRNMINNLERGILLVKDRKVVKVRKKVTGNKGQDNSWAV